MKVKTWIKYEESYLPPRCRKLRYRECEEYVDITLKEVDPAELQLAFEDNSFEGKGKIFFYKGRLWAKSKRNWCIAKDHGTKSALEDLLWANEHCSSYFRFDFDRERYGADTSREAVIKKARKDMRDYILVDGELYSVSSEPRYTIYTFGLGFNHGGTALSVDYHYNPNISKNNYFSALDGEAAVAYANKTAAARGDTDDIGKFKANIVVLLPELVKVKPQKQHGDGNPLLNDFEEISQCVNDPLTAALLCMTTASNYAANSAAT